MSEAFGSILIKSTDEALMASLETSDDAVSWEQIVKLVNSAGIKSTSGLHPRLHISEGKDFLHHGLELANGYADIATFGGEWMHVMQPLVKKGEGIEIYGSILHEHGVKEFYALNAKGQSFFDAIVDDNGDEIDDASVMQAWLSVVPDDVKEHFPEVFMSE